MAKPPTPPKPTFENYGTPDYPVRCSSVPYLLRCPARIIMLHLAQPDRTSNVYSDTGTAAHLAISHWHKGSEVDAALREMRSSVANFPHADLERAEVLASAYFKDSRNSKEAVVESEWLMTFELPPHPMDPTKRPITLQGTLDQLRRENALYVWDYKTGADDGATMLHDFAPQLAAYAYGAALAFNEPVYVGGIIRGRGYIDGRTKKPKADPEPDGVFFRAGMTPDDCAMLLYRLRWEVAGMRSGFALLGPGGLCNTCPHGGAVSACAPLGRGMGLKLAEV